MSVSGISSTNSVSQNDWQSKFAQSQQYFNALGKALESGNLSAAQSAFSSLQQLMPNSSQNSTTTTGAGGTNSIGSAFNALGQALQSGNLADAQKAFAQVQQTMQTAQFGHHHSSQSRAASTSTSTSTVSQSTLNQIQTYVSEGMTASQIAQKLGISVSTLMQEAQAAGINLHAGSSSPATSGNPAVGNNVNTTA